MAPLETATLEPTPSATPATFASIALTGKGNKVPKFTIPEDQAAIAIVTNKGSGGNFAVTSLAADGTDNELLVNVIGNYSGTVLFDASSGQHSVAFRVESDGTWAITVKPLSAATTWDPTTPLAGRGDDVIAVVPAVTGLTTATVAHNGTSNFAVFAYNDAGSHILVNEIGTFSGEESLPSGTYLLKIVADGAWTVTPT